MKISSPFLAALAVFITAGVTSTAFAGEHNYGPYPSYYSEECGSCHVPYPPQRMTQAGWQTQINGLKNHYGTDASVDAPASQTILSYLVNNAAWKEKLAPTDPTARITKTRWFTKEHGATAPKGKSFSDCAQCHTKAVQGDFNEQSLKVPAGWLK